MKRFAALLLAMLICMTGAFCAFGAEIGLPATTSSYQVTVYLDYSGLGSLALKSEPDDSAGTYVYLPDRTSLHINQVSGGWGQVTYGDMTGWVQLRYTRVAGNYPTTQPPYGLISPVYYTVERTEGEGLELRTLPTTDASTFGPLYDGTVLKAQAQSGEWVYGEHDGHYGWCNTYYLRYSTQDEINRYEGQGTQGQAVQTNFSISETFPADNGYVQEYIDVLTSNRAAIELYDWQMYSGTGTGTTRAVTLSDIYGDEVPELIYVSAPGGEYANPELHIVTIRDGVASTLYVTDWDKPRMTGGYVNYYLFRMSDKSSLYLYQDQGDDGGSETYGRLDFLTDGTAAITELFRHKYSPYSTDEYYRRATAVDESTYNTGINQAEASTSGILMYSSGCGRFVDDYVERNGCSAMTLDEALTFLETLRGSTGATPSGGASITF